MVRATGKGKRKGRGTRPEPQREERDRGERLRGPRATRVRGVEPGQPCLDVGDVFFGQLGAFGEASGSWSLNPIYRINALQITIRVWDAKTRQSRQTTMIVDM